MNTPEIYGLICKEIEDCIKHNKKSFYIYPFGSIGLYVKNILNNRYGIIEKGLIDNKLSYFNADILNINDIKQENLSDDSIILISSDSALTIAELVKSLPSFVSPKQISFIFNEVWEKWVTDNMDFDIFYKHCKIGKRTDNYKSLLTPFPLVENIGRYCSINPTAKVVQNHSLDKVASGWLLGFSDMNTEEYRHKLIEYEKKYGKHKDNCWAYSEGTCCKNPPINIGNNVWIGQNVVILPGVTIHDGAVCGAGAVVTHDVSPYTIVGGVPAKTIRKRHSEEIIAKLLRISWWNWSDDKIKENLEYFYSTELFLKKFGNSD